MTHEPDSRLYFCECGFTLREAPGLEPKHVHNDDSEHPMIEGPDDGRDVDSDTPVWRA